MKRSHARCKYCNARITWLKDRDNNNVPVDGHLNVTDGLWDIRMGKHQTKCSGPDYRTLPDPEPILLQQTGPGRVAIPAVNAPDLQKEAAKRKA